MLLTALALWVALAIDRWLVEPRGRWHPVVWMGSYLGRAGRHLPRLARQGTQLAHPGAADATPDFKEFWLGALAWSTGVAIVCIAAWVLQNGLMILPVELGPMPGGLLVAGAEAHWLWLAAAGAGKVASSMKLLFGATPHVQSGKVTTTLVDYGWF